MSSEEREKVLLSHRPSEGIIYAKHIIPSLGESVNKFPLYSSFEIICKTYNSFTRRECE